MNRKILASALSALLVAGGLAIVATAPASATEQCVPSDAVPAWTEVVPDIEHPAVYETVEITPATEGTPAVWANFSPNDQQATFVGPAVYPVDERGTWHDHGTLPPGQAGPDGVYANGNPDKGGNWFYRQAAVPGTDAVTEERLVTEAYTEVVPDIEHPEIPAVTCEPEEPEPVDPIACTAYDVWYTEQDDVAPTQIAEGLAFISAGDGKAVGYRQAIGGNLQGLAPIRFSATGDLSQFFLRFTVDLSADGGPAYKSLSIPGATTITSDSEVYQFPGMTLADVAEAYPNNVLTSVGWQTNSGAPAGVGAVLHSFAGACGAMDFTVPPVVVPEQPEDSETVDCDAGTVTTVTHVYDAETNAWEPVTSTREATEAECPIVVEPPVEPEEPTEPEEPVAPSEPEEPVENPVDEEPEAKPATARTQALAETGGADPTPFAWLAGGLLMVGGLAFAARTLIARKR